MAAKDVFHDAVKQALIKDGWTITHDPLTIKLGKRPMFIDLAAENLLAAKREDRYIAVEIKSFIGTSDLEAFHLALGQYLNYRLALQDKHKEYQLFLAVPVETFKEFFQEALPQTSIKTYKVHLIVYDPTEEVIVSWIK
jgi:XisH protein